MIAAHERHELQKRHSAHSVATETVATQTDATGNPGTGSKKKKKKKKKKKSDAVSELASERALSEIGLEDEEGHSDSEDESITIVVRGHRSNSQEVEIERSQNGSTITEVPPVTDREAFLGLPLSVRLEKAASHPDLKAGLAGLVEWSATPLSPAVVSLFFGSKTLKLLLENFFRVCPVHAHLYDNLTKLFANLLATSFPFQLDDGRKSSSVEAARLVVQSIRSTVDSLLSLKRYKDKSPVVAGLIPQVATSLSTLIVNHQALGAPADTYDLARDILKLDVTLQDMVANENAVRGMTIRDTFRRRDLRAEALAISGHKMTSLLSLVVQANATRSATVAATPELAPSSAGAVPALDLDGQDVTSLEARLSQLNKDKAAQLAPWLEKKTKVANELLELKLRQDELRKMLADVDSRVHILQHLHGDMVGEMATIEATFEEEIGRFGAENMAVVSHLQGVEKKQEIVGAFRGLRTTLDDLSATALRQKVQANTHEHLNSVRRYLSAQAICIQYTKNRILDSETQCTKLRMEAQAAESLGEDTSALASQIDILSASILEDKKSLRPLERRDAEVRGQVESLLATLEAEGAKGDAEARITWNAATVAEIRELFTKVFSVYAEHAAEDLGAEAPSAPASGPLAMDEDEAAAITRENLARLERGQRPLRTVKQ
ncbi:hypothetical protein ACHHYP_02144 [Achlya hypogyna]|uniref:Uncharacterized protein n=1 Tax=Achlya hypogyna TaxID=1202772 RepID=A0A1V9ZSA0_ACHHY|nr:hypothetical protein ACHHYP_02144 [Achlya hypogyna]